MERLPQKGSLRERTVELQPTRQMHLPKQCLKVSIRSWNSLREDILSAPALGLCYQTHLQDAGWSDSGEVLDLLHYSSSHSSSTQFFLQGIRKIKKKSMESKQLHQWKKREKHKVFFSFHRMCRCSARLPYFRNFRSVMVLIESLRPEKMEIIYHLQVNDDSRLVTTGLHNMAKKCFHKHCPGNCYTKCFPKRESRKLLHSCSTSVEEISRDFQ